MNSLFKRPKLDLEVNDRIWISHNAGNPNVSVFMSLSNVGNRDVSIKSIQMLVSPSDGQQFELPAKSFYPSLTDEKWVIFSRFKLYAGTQWDHTTIFWKPFSRNNEFLYRQLSSAIKDDISKKKGQPEFEKILVEAEQKNVDSFVKFFDERFKWQRGEYTLTLTVVTDRDDVTASKKFRFTLFDSDVNQLRAYADKYRYGVGVYYFNREIQAPLDIPIVRSES